jgi:hypothetical protein
MIKVYWPKKPLGKVGRVFTIIFILIMFSFSWISSRIKKFYKNYKAPRCECGVKKFSTVCKNNNHFIDIRDRKIKKIIK